MIAFDTIPSLVARIHDAYPHTVPLDQWLAPSQWTEETMKQFDRVDAQFEEALVNLLAYWFSEHGGGDGPGRVPELAYRLGWLLDRGMENYGDIAIGDLADILKDAARARGYTEELEL